MIDDEANDEQIINEILEMGENNEAFEIPEEDMIEFLRIVGKRQVVMEAEAEEMLQDYFTATRKIRESEETMMREWLTALLNFRFPDTESLRGSPASGRVARETLPERKRDSRGCSRSHQHQRELHSIDVRSGFLFVAGGAEVQQLG
jgi:hypothetical protein